MRPARAREWPARCCARRGRRVRPSRVDPMVDVGGEYFTRVVDQLRSASPSRSRSASTSELGGDQSRSCVRRGGCRARGAREATSSATRCRSRWTASRRVSMRNICTASLTSACSRSDSSSTIASSSVAALGGDRRRVAAGRGPDRRQRRLELVRHGIEDVRAARRSGAPPRRAATSCSRARSSPIAARLAIDCNTVSLIVPPVSARLPIGAPPSRMA